MKQDSTQAALKRAARPAWPTPGAGRRARPGAVGHVQLFVDGAQPVSHGINGEIQRPGDLLVVRTLGHQAQDGHLASGQRLDGGACGGW